MRNLILAAALLAAACTSSPPPPDKQAVQAETQALLAPLPGGLEHGPLSGYVAARDERTLSLDSGGPHLIPLKIDMQTPATIDGQPARATDIREGSIVRASYQMGEDGQPKALAIIAESKPITGTATPPSAILPSNAQPGADQPAGAVQSSRSATAGSTR